MLRNHSQAWKSSAQRRKQRKYRANAPLHIRKDFVKAHLAKDLIQKHKKRSAGVRTGDKVIVSRGQYKGKSGKVERVSVKKTRVYITGIDITKKDGSKYLIPIQPSNVIITELNMEDKKRSMKFKSDKK